MTKPLARRTILRGVGACIALPWLEAMQPSTVRASGSNTLKATGKTGVASYRIGNVDPDFKPQSTGLHYELSPTLQPVQKYRDQLSVLSGLFHEHAFRRNPQTGRHVQDTMCHLTGADLSGTRGSPSETLFPSTNSRHSMSGIRLASERSICLPIAPAIWHTRRVARESPTTGTHGMSSPSSLRTLAQNRSKSWLGLSQRREAFSIP